jgi:hypothetical protein
MGDDGGDFGGDGSFGGSFGDAAVGSFGGLGDVGGLGGGLGGMGTGGLGDASFGGDSMGAGGGMGDSPFSQDFSQAFGAMPTTTDSLGGSLGGIFGSSEVAPGAYGDLGVSLSDGYAPGIMDNIAKFAQTPWGKAALTAISFANPALGMALGIGNMAMQGAQGKGGQAMGGALGSAIGGFAGGPIGSQLGGMVGASALGGHQGVAGNPANDFGQGTNLGGGIIGGLASLYGYNKNQQGNKEQLSTLQNMYGPDSPYAQQLRQSLSRKDAASGRRSQYGPREVALQAQLAQQYSRNAPVMAQLNQQNTANRNAMLAQLGGVYRQMGGLSGISSAGSAISGGFQGLSDMYGGGGWGTGNDFGNMDLGLNF